MLLHQKKLFTLFDVPVYAHWSAIILCILAAQFGAAFGELYMIPFTIVVLLGIILAHEYGHILVGRYFGYKTERITVLGLGMAASMYVPPGKHRGETRIALAGPGVNVVLMLFTLALYTMLDSYAIVTEPVKDMMGVFFGVNAMLFAFNMLPAYPLDGGRALRATLMHWMSPYKATYMCAWIGTVILGALACYMVMLGSIFSTLVCILIIVFSWAEVKNLQRRTGML